MSKPNFLIFVVDEKRYPTKYESKALKEWRQTNLKFEQEMIDHGIVFHRHYTNSTACVPSRATLHTGQYPTVHGVTQTDGLALEATDPEMTWLKESTVPTIGNYFQEAGYKTYLKGKWHVTDASIRLNNGETLMTFDSEGNRLLDRENFYLKKNVLKKFGYNGWIGPEPHGTLPLNSAAAVPYPEKGRDIAYQQQVLEELKKVEGPWLMMASFVNPHDITLFGLLSEQSPNFDFPIDPTLPEQLFTSEFEASLHETLKDKPKAQRFYRDHYHKYAQPVGNLDRYYRAYYTMQKEVDQRLQETWKAFKSHPDYNNTIVLFLSDHGDLLSAHGNMHQKWFNAYQESIHIPFIIRSPLLGDCHRDVKHPTSHIDILPTLLGLANLNQEKLRERLGSRFSLNLPLPGRDLSPFLKGKIRKFLSEPIYFMSEDNPTKGPHQENVLGKPYTAVPDPASLEAVITGRWKLTRYYSQRPGDSPREGELYNLEDDPLELNNLFDRNDYSEIKSYLIDLLERLSFKYRY